MNKLLIIVFLFNYNQNIIDKYVSNIDLNKDIKSIEKILDLPSCNGANLTEYYLKDSLVKSTLYIGQSNNYLEIKYYLKNQALEFIEYNSYSFKYDDDTNIFRDSIYLSLKKSYYLENNIAIDSNIISYNHEYITPSSDIYFKEMLSLYFDLKFIEE